MHITRCLLFSTGCGAALKNKKKMKTFSVRVLYKFAGASAAATMLVGVRAWHVYGRLIA